MIRNIKRRRDKMSSINGRRSSPSSSSSKSIPKCCQLSPLSSGPSCSPVCLPVSATLENRQGLISGGVRGNRHSDKTTSLLLANVTSSATSSGRANTSSIVGRCRQCARYQRNLPDKCLDCVCHKRSLSALISSSDIKNNKLASRRRRREGNSSGNSENNYVGDYQYCSKTSGGHANSTSSRAVPSRWPTKIASGPAQYRRSARTSSTRAQTATTTMLTAGATAHGRGILGAISLVSLLIILAHICQICLPPVLSGQLGSVAAAQSAAAVETSEQGGSTNYNYSNNEAAGGRQANTGASENLLPTLPAQAQDKREREGDRQAESWRSGPVSMRDMRDARLSEKLLVNMSNVFEVLLKKRPYSRYWTVEQKWDDLFTRAEAVSGTVRQVMVKNFMRDIEYYADMALSPACEKDLKYIQSYMRQSTNFRWLAHMFDATGKSEPGILTGMLANLGHPVQCIRVRAPARPTNDSFDERFFERQTEVLGERFRGKYCVASVRPVLPPKPTGIAVSRFSNIMNASALSNISYTGEPVARLKQRTRQLTVPASVHSTIHRDELRFDQVPFESELYAYLIAQRNFMFTLPRFMGVCFPSSCSRDDIRISLQKSLDDQHQVVDIEFECEQEEVSSWQWFSTPRLIAYVLLALISGLVFLASLARYILLSKLQIRRARLPAGSKMAGLLDTLDMFSMDKCAGILFVKTRRASPVVDWTRVENNRSTSIDALRGALILALVYAQMVLLGCLPIPFMWAKWSDAMFPFFRSLGTQVFINVSIWSEAFYMISAYLIALKVLENYRPKLVSSAEDSGGALGNNTMSCKVRGTFGGLESGWLVAGSAACQLPSFFSFAIKRYMRLALPMLSFVLLNYVWPRLSNGFVMQDQANKLLRACDTFGWTNFLMFHNHHRLNETCLWPSHASASFFQLHLLSYPILVLCIVALYTRYNLDADYDEHKGRRVALARVFTGLAFGAIALLGMLGLVWPALQASKRSLIVPFLIDYLDYDNYQRVLEWTVMPTYNHLTSYMTGIALAFIVVRRKASAELQRLEASQWYCESGRTGQYNQRQDSVESIRSSSTQELHQAIYGAFKQPPFATVNHQYRADRHAFSAGQRPTAVRHFTTSSGDESSVCDTSSDHRDDGNASFGRRGSTSSAVWLRVLANLSCCFVCLGSLLASWLWNGLGQPMSNEQTFWYMILTKLCFCATFAYLFHEHAATRPNSTNPWIVTRFLVPIGRMSLTVFYTSWLVIWFDLLASLHQWHPSHYFICEKYNEIIFITLIVAMFVYGPFEGIVKRIQYSARLERVKHDIRLRMSFASAGSATMITSRAKRTLKVKPFESFFEPRDKPSWQELATEYKLSGNLSDDGSTNNNSKSGGSKPATGSGSGELAPGSTSVIVTAGDDDQQQRVPGGGARPVFLMSYPSASDVGSGGDLTPASTRGGNLSSSDRYKLNAELRANYSFASIGLYESAGATGDLSHLASDNGSSRDHRR